MQRPPNHKYLVIQKPSQSNDQLQRELKIVGAALKEQEMSVTLPKMQQIGGVVDQRLTWPVRGGFMLKLNPSI